MYAPKKRASVVSTKSASTGSSNQQAGKKKATVVSDALFDLETYIKNRDYVGALTLLGLKRQQQQDGSGDGGGADRAATSKAEIESGLDHWRVNTWWLAYCHFQCGDFAGALDYFDQLLDASRSAQARAGPESSHDHTSDEENWRLSRACCLYYLQQFEVAEQAALGAKRHALCNRLLYLIAHRRKHGEQVLLDRYQQLSPSSVEDLLALAFTSFLQRNFQESIEIYKRLLQQSKHTELGAVHVYLAMCYFKADYYDVSLELLAVYLASHPDSFFASNLKACNQYRLYSGYEAGQVLEEFKLGYPKHACAQQGGGGSGDVYDSMGIREVETHNSIVFQEANSGLSGSTPAITAGGEAAAPVATLKSLVGVIDEAKMNLVLCHLQHREYEKAFELVEAEDLEPKTSSEHIIKGILHGVIGEETSSKEHVFLAEKHFHAVGSSPEESDTIPGRQAMASYFLLRKEYEDANMYLNSIAQYLSSSDTFNWNYGIALAAAGSYSEAEEVLLRVHSEVLKPQLTLCSWLARCYIYNSRNAGNAWELYLKMENTSDAYKLLKLIANDYYKVKNYYYAVKAFDVLERLDPDPEYWEAKRGACVGFYREIATGAAAFDAHRSDDVLKMLLNSKNTLESSKLAAILKKWVLGSVNSSSQHRVGTGREPSALAASAATATPTDEENPEPLNDHRASNARWKKLFMLVEGHQSLEQGRRGTSVCVRVRVPARERVSMAEQLLPWGRFKLVSKDPADESDHLYFYRKTHRIGRNARRSDIILDKLFISSTHCVVTFDDAEEADGEPTVMIQDLSRNGVYLNEVLVGASNSAVLENNITVHFTKPGLRTRSITPTVYKFELLQDGLTEENTRLRNARESVTYTPAASTRSTAVDVPVTQPEPSFIAAAHAVVTHPETAAATQVQTSSSTSSSVATLMIRPNPEVVGQKRSVDETEFELETTTRLSAGDESGAARSSSALSASSSSGSGSSAKKKRRSGEAPEDAGSADDGLNTSVRIQQSNQVLRQRLDESRSREVQLCKQLSEAELEIITLTDKMEKCEERGKQLADDLKRKQEELDVRDTLIAQLKQNKFALEGKLADSVQALELANETIESQTSVIEDLEKDKKALGSNLDTVTGQLSSSITKAAALGEKVMIARRVRELEVEKRELSVSKLTVERVRESVEESVEDVQEKKDLMAERLAKALDIFETIHQQIQTGLTLGDSPVFAKEIKKHRRRRLSVDSIMVEHSIEEQRQLADNSFGSSEQSQPTPVHSSDVNTQDPDESETMDQDAALVGVPLQSLNPFLVGSHQALPQAPTFQNTADESETQQLRSAGEGVVREGTPDQQRGDSEESVISVRSASKTPPAKPIQMASTPKKQQEEQGGGEEEDDVNDDVVVVPEVAAGADVDDADSKEQQQEDEEAMDDEVNADNEAKTPAEETKEDVGDNDDEDDGDDDVVIVDAPTPAAAATADKGEEEEQAEEQAEAADDKADDDEDVTTTTEQEKKGGKDATAEDEDEADDNNDEDEPPVPSRSATDQQHWLPTISPDESLDNQTNASEGADIFDDETQLSQ